MSVRAPKEGGEAGAIVPVWQAPVLGMLCMLVATACFATMNAMIRGLGLSGDIPPVAIAFWRAFLGFLLLLPLALWWGRASIRTGRLGFHALRGSLQAVSMILFFVGLSLTPLAKATAFEFAAPILATLLAVLFLGERLRIRRIAAMAVGLIGVLIVLRPGVIPLSLGPVLVIVSVILWAACQLMIRSLARTDTSFAQAFYMALFLTPVAGLTALAWGWVWPKPEVMGVLALIALVATIGTWLYGEAFRRAEMSAALPLESTKILWTASFGWVFFAEEPDAMTLFGGFVIFAAAAYITVREAQLKHAEGRPAPAPVQEGPAA